MYINWRLKSRVQGTRLISTGGQGGRFLRKKKPLVFVPGRGVAVTWRVRWMWMELATIGMDRYLLTSWCLYTIDMIWFVKISFDGFSPLLLEGDPIGLSCRCWWSLNYSHVGMDGGIKIYTKALHGHLEGGRLCPGPDKMCGHVLEFYGSDIYHGSSWSSVSYLR